MDIAGENMASHRRVHPFHNKCGTLISLSDDDKSARRNDSRQEFNNGLVFSKRPLKDGEVYEVIIDEKVCSFWVGSCLVDLEQPGSMLCETAYVKCTFFS